MKLSTHPIHIGVFAALALSAAVAPSAHAAEKLGQFPLDPGEVSVAGFSSGAFMANQLHVAHSAGMMGAAMIAGGLYGCAVEEVTPNGVAARASLAFGPCVKNPIMLDEVSSYTDFRQHLAKYMDEVWDSRAHLRVTRQNARSVIVLSEAEYEGMMETLHLLRSPTNADRLRRSIESAEAGELTEREVAGQPARAK